jgi:hypothetical protein
LNVLNSAEHLIQPYQSRKKEERRKLNYLFSVERNTTSLYNWLLISPSLPGNSCQRAARLLFLKRALCILRHVAEHSSPANADNSITRSNFVCVVFNITKMAKRY